MSDKYELAERQFNDELAKAPDPVAFAVAFPNKIEHAIALAETPEELNNLRALAEMGNRYLRQTLPRAVAERQKQYEYMHPTEAAYIRASAKAGQLWKACENKATQGSRKEYQSNMGNISDVVRPTDAGFKGRKDAAACMHVGDLHEEDLRTYLDEQLQEESHATLYGAERVWRMLNAKPVEFEIDGMYRVWYADPPWSYGNQRGGGTTEQTDHYATMTTQDICDIPVKQHSLDNAVLFLWATSPILYPDAFKVMTAWGFTYKSSFIWDKVDHNMGYYNSVRHEFLLIGTRGACTPDVVKLYDSVQSIPRSEVHSRKPEEFRAIIEELYPHGNRAELFARDEAEGWNCYGSEV